MEEAAAASSGGRKGRRYGRGDGGRSGRRRWTMSMEGPACRMQLSVRHDHLCPFTSNDSTDIMTEVNNGVWGFLSWCCQVPPKLRLMLTISSIVHNIVWYYCILYYFIHILFSIVPGKRKERSWEWIGSPFRTRYLVGKVKFHLSPSRARAGSVILHPATGPGTNTNIIYYFNQYYLHEL